MKRNVGVLDRDIRLGLGAILLFIGIFLTPLPMNLVFIAISLVLIFTAAKSSCPIYSAVGMSTREKETLKK